MTTGLRWAGGCLALLRLSPTVTQGMAPKTCVSAALKLARCSSSEPPGKRAPSTVSTSTPLVAAAERAAPNLPAFEITFRKLGPRDANVFLGSAPVGYQSPERIQLSVIDATRERHDFNFVDRRYAGIAGGLT